MLIQIEKWEELDPRKLMDLYQEGNIENIDYFYPGTRDRKAALEKIEENFLNYLREDFFSREKNCYYILEKDGVWVSALRLNYIEEHFFYMEALETHPDYRRQGYATELLGSLLEEWKEKQGGTFRICDNVGQGNKASLATHKKCGFVIAQNPGYDYLRGQKEEGMYGLEYRYDRTQPDLGS